MNLPRHHLPPLPEGRAYTFHAMVKPGGAACNLNCSYCFYLHKTGLLKQETNPVMSDDVLEQHIRQYIDGQTGRRVVFSWQGGEPTILGLRFFEKVVALQRKYKKPGQIIENDLQTNGILLNDEWMRFLKTHRFHVGLSIDGPRHLHDKFRRDKGGKPTFDKVMKATELLRRYQVPFAVLCVVNRENAREPLAVYRFLSRCTGTYRIQFSPVVEPVYFERRPPKVSRTAEVKVQSLVTDWSVTPKLYGSFLKAVWDEWLTHDYGSVHVNLFETAVAQSLGLPAQLCTTAPFCGKGVAVEANGDVYSCDHLVYSDYKLGNIMAMHEADMAFSSRQVNFGMAKSDKLPKFCRRCRHLKLCWGECPKNRLLRTPDGQKGLNYLCAGLYDFFEHIQQDLPQIHRQIQQTVNCNDR